MNYFFLREVFNKQISSDNVSNIVLSELDVLLREISKEDLTEEMIEIISTELDEGDYMSDYSFEEVETMFKEAINRVLGCDNDKLFAKYINIAKKIYQKM